MSRTPLAVKLPMSKSNQIVNMPTMGDPFLVDMNILSEAALRHKYNGEAISHARILADAKQHKCTVHPGFGRFKDFLRAVGSKPRPTHTLDRIDSTDPEYAPGKVRWASPKEQANNRSTTILLRGPDGRSEPLTKWAKQTGQSAAAMRKRKERGWSDAEIIAGMRGAVLPTGATAQAPRISENPWPTGLPDADAAIWEQVYPLFKKLVRLRCPDEGPPAYSRAMLAGWLIRRRIWSANRWIVDRLPDWMNGAEVPPDIAVSTAFRYSMAAPAVEYAARDMIGQRHFAFLLCLQKRTEYVDGVCTPVLQKLHSGAKRHT
jgi:hypothetical protein